MGHEVEVIDYVSSSHNALCDPGVPKHLAGILRRPRTIVGDLRSLWDRVAHFRAAQQDIANLALGPRITDSEQLSSLDYDRVILGSDEIWNLENPIMGGDLSYAGQFFESEGLCAYAPSFGSVDNPSHLPPEMMHALGKIQHLSARDRNTAALLTQLGLNPTLVVDPTLLERRVPINGSGGAAGNRIVLYGAPVGKECLDLLEEVAIQEQLELHSIIYPQSTRISHKSGVNATEFLRVFGASRAVITTTFHGTIFAILAGKPFAVVAPGQKRNKVTDLLRMFGAEDRLVRDLDSLPGLLAEPLDADSVNQKLDSAAGQSMEFLRNALA